MEDLHDIKVHSDKFMQAAKELNRTPHDLLQAVVNSFLECHFEEKAEKEEEEAQKANKVTKRDYYVWNILDVLSRKYPDDSIDELFDRAIPLADDLIDRINSSDKKADN